MFKVATNEEIDDLVHAQVQRYKSSIIKELQDRYKSNQKVSCEALIEILDETYETDFEPYFFEVTEGED